MCVAAAISSAGLPMMRAWTSAGTADDLLPGGERHDGQHGVDERAEPGPSRTSFSARHPDHLDLGCLRDGVVDPLLRGLSCPGRRGLHPNARHNALFHELLALSAPALVVGQAVLDGEHVAVFDDQVVAAKTKGRCRVEMEEGRVPPHD